MKRMISNTIGRKITIADISMSTWRLQYQPLHYPSQDMAIHNTKITGNSVKRFSSNETDSLPTKEMCVSPDHHPATVCNKGKIIISTWNVRTLYKCWKANGKQKMQKPNINILGVFKRKWINSGFFTSSDYRIIYTGGERNGRRVGLILDNSFSHSSPVNST